MNHAPSAVVQNMDNSNVDTVIVDERVVKRDGRLVGVDVEAVLQQLERSAAGLVNRSRATDVLFTGAGSSRTAISAVVFTAAACSCSTLP
ncbi:hypothetical protein [Nocardia asiatica]|uniref:hypothetical protein n=1 Tax=Nocardia asiatica TaxID=209252 RepID=UPI002458EE6F|nr:hypothetical protein [Nocardia asiatica]